MLDPPEMTAHTRHILGLYFPLRARVEWGRPIPVSDMLGYLELRGLVSWEMFEWFSVADGAAMEWMGEQQKQQMAQARQKSETRH